VLKRGSVIFFLKRQSRFISFHALQVLLFQGILLFLTMIGMTAFFLVFGISFATGAFQQKTSGPPIFFFFFFGAFMLGTTLSWIVKLVLAISHGVKAGRGEWSEYPLLGKLARKILHVGPGGAEMSL
jgi:uncharacterized membrane protein